ncbi:MAG: glycosyltransferase family 2 protein [Methanobrevibacter sp.]|uniref:glycosyltransferase family 2 protein n=1 Tax=Methanobrevibacter sp. TaxID=66852 RepID=UPI003F0F8CFE
MRWCKMGFGVSEEDKKNTYVILPAYNESTRIQPVIEKIAEKGYNMVIVNDGSSDNTLKVIKDSQRKYPNQIFIYSHMINRGVGVAMQTGFEAVLKYNPKYIVNMDSDGQHDVDDLENVLEPLIEGRAQAVIGVRPLKDMPLTRNIANAIMNLLTRIFYRVNVSDSQTGFRAITIDALRKIEINSRGYLISSEFIREVNDNKIPFEEVEIKTIYTPETQAKGTNTSAALKILFQMIKHQFR